MYRVDSQPTIRPRATVGVVISPVTAIEAITTFDASSGTKGGNEWT